MPRHDSQVSPMIQAIPSVSTHGLVASTPIEWAPRSRNTYWAAIWA